MTKMEIYNQLQFNATVDEDQNHHPQYINDAENSCEDSRADF